MDNQHIDKQQAAGSGLTALWDRLSIPARWGLGVGVSLCIGLAVLLLLWAIRTDYQVLFAQLEEADAGAIVEMLRDKKIPYRLSQQGKTIQVPAAQVYETRLTLMSGGTPLTGVGFELFDRQGMGTTEQAQRVTYQRALQGELARTIATLEPVQQARVLVVMPEPSLFKREQQQPRAAVTVQLAAGLQLQPAQVAGIQRLVAASVAGLEMSQVVVTDQRGVTLSAPDANALQPAASSARLTLKDEYEHYLSRKITLMLERTLGTGQAIVSVDATLNFDQVTRSLKTVLPVTGSTESNNDHTGAVIHRRENNSSATPNRQVQENSRPSTGHYALDIEYEYSQRLEQVVAAPGAVMRLSVSVIVLGELSAEREARLLQLVRAAAGIDSARGDTVVLDSGARVAASNILPTSTAAALPHATAVQLPPTHTSFTLHELTGQTVLMVAIALCVGVLLGGWLWRLHAGRSSALQATRAALLQEVLVSLQQTRSGTQQQVP